MEDGTYKSKQPSYIMSIWHGKHTLFGVIWDLYFEFLAFNEQDRIRSCIPNAQSAGLTKPAGGRSNEDCHGYCSSVLWRLVLVCLCTPLIALCTLGAPVYMLIMGVWSCLSLAGRCLCDMCTSHFCCSSDREALQNDEQNDGHRTETMVTGDQYYNVRYRAVYDEIKKQKRRYSHQHSVVLIAQALLNVAALVVSEPSEVLQYHGTSMSGDAAYSAGPRQPVTAISRVGQPEPVALCLPSADVGTRDRYDGWVETQLDDECTQVMRYASCEDFRCVSHDPSVLRFSMVPSNVRKYMC